MRETIRDKERLIHIDEAIRRITDETTCNLDDIKEGSLEYFGVVKLIEIIGEAVYKLTNDFKDSHTQTPWRQIERMRHVLVHGYYTISFDFIKETILTDIPILRCHIQKYISEFD